MALDANLLEPWHGKIKRSLDAALADALRRLRGLLQSELTPAEFKRVHFEPGRVKDVERVVAKCSKPEFVGRIYSVEDVAKVIPDLIGLRIVCSNKTLVEKVRTIISEKVLADVDRINALTKPNYLDTQIADYVKNPHSTGYRAIHIVIGVQSGDTAQFQLFNCEVQIRTLLQNAWGELSRVDFYESIGAPMPREVEKHSYHLAELLAAQDGIVDSLVAAIESASTSTKSAIASPQISSEIVVSAVVDSVNSDRLILLMYGGGKGIVRADAYKASPEIPVDLTVHYSPGDQLRVKLVSVEVGTENLLCQIVERVPNPTI